MGLNAKYSAKLDEFNKKFSNAILVYTLKNGNTVEVVSMIEVNKKFDPINITGDMSSIMAYIPKWEQSNGKITYLPGTSDDFDYTEKIYFMSNDDCLEKDSIGAMFQLILALSGAKDAIVMSSTPAMKKEGIVSVALSFEK